MPAPAASGADLGSLSPSGHTAGPPYRGTPVPGARAVIELLHTLGIAAFAVSGVEASRARRPDWVGALILAFVTALGGGVLRDAILGRPAQSFASGMHLWVILGASALALWQPGAVRRLLPSLRVADALGLGLFNATGMAVALESGQVAPGFAIVLGAVTGTGGGILRDVLCGEMPALLRPGEIYITACLAGGIAGLTVHALGAGPDGLALSSAIVTIAVRLLAIRFGWKLGPVSDETDPPAATRR